MSACVAGAAQDRDSVDARRIIGLDDKLTKAAQPLAYRYLRLCVPVSGSDSIN